MRSIGPRHKWQGPAKQRIGRAVWQACHALLRQIDDQRQPDGTMRRGRQQPHAACLDRADQRGGAACHDIIPLRRLDAARELRALAG